MEQFVLGFFQEQLSKIIVGFRKEQINANLLNGKGEITNVSLNCQVLNEQHVRKVTSLLEIQDVHLSRLGFHVTSWANLRKAPIVVDIGKVTVVLKEPLELLPKAQRKRLKILRERELVELLLNGTFQPFRGSGSYGFSDRIVDNLTIEMESLQIQWQAWGKFKTQRPGPWRPPLLQIDMEHLKVVAVDEYGHEAPPEQVWAHNRFGQKEFMLYKKIMGEVHVKLVDQNGGVEVNLIRHLHFENQMVVKRRLRDGAILGIQTDLTIPKLDMEIQAHDIPILAHWLVASQYCLGKEKSFEDPLKEANDDDDGGEEVSPSPTEAGPAWLAASEGGEDGEDSDDDENDDLNEGNATYDDAGSIASNDRDTSFMADDQSQATQTSRTGSIDAPYKERPIILLPNGIVIYDAVCFTCSIHDATIRGVYATGRNGYVQVSSKGCITEFMWPKAESEPGIYLQASASFVSIQERLDQSVRTIVIGGITQGDHLSIHKPRKAAAQVKADENFPMFERRSLRDDPLELRHTFPSQAFGIKTTIDVLMPDDSDKGDSSLPPMSLLEIGTNEFDIVLDADAWCRSFSFLLNEQGGGFDPRWTTGDWTEVLSPDMLKDPSAPLQLDEHLQIAKQVFLDDNFMLSSDRFNITARFSNFELRVPAAVKENIRSCDILIQLQETTIVMSSALPRTFLNGKIGNSISGDGNDSEVAVDFPNDPSDVAYSLISSEDPSLRLSGAALSRSVSTCRAQITLRGFQVQTIPIIPYCNAPQTQQLISPMEMTSIICFEGEPPPPESNLTKIALFYSVHVYDLTVNFDFDLLAGATSSVIYHSGVATTAICRWINLFSAQSNMHLSVAESQSYADDVEDDPINKTLKGRRIMVKRQFARSRETGGLSVVFCMQLSKLHYTMWRQNVPYYSPFRPPPNKDSTHESSVIELLKLVDLCATEFEFGLEFEFHVPSGRRTVLKCCVDEGHLLVCDVSKVMQSLTGVSNDMVKLIAFGKDKLPSQLHQAYPGTQQHVAIRLEEQLKESTRSWSLSSDLNCQAIIDTSHNEVKDVVILVLEELLLPTWSKRELPFSEDAPFPAKTIGALFYHLFVLLMQIIPKSTGDVLKVPMPPETTEENVISTIERVLKSLCARFLPKDLSLILFRIEIANLLLSIPDSTTQRLGLHLMQADVVTRLVPNRSMRDIEMEHMLACKGIPWSTLIKSKSDRFYQSVMSRQSLLVLKSEDLELEIEELVHPFKVGLTYAASRIHLEMSEDLRITDIRRLELFSDGLIALRDQCLQNVATLSSYLQIMMQRKQQSRSLTNGHAAFSQDDSDDLAVKEQLDNTSTTTAIRPSFGKVQRALQLAQSELSDYEQKVAEDRLQTKARVEELEKKVFTKERDRFAAIALTTSRIAGWMRTGNIQATGQRVGRMATLWPFWVVLRKNLLLVYPSPGESRPVEMLVLNGAKIRQLAGGRSRTDVKRGFAVVEVGGNTQYFVAASSREYANWVGTITATIAEYTNADDNANRNDENEFEIERVEDTMTMPEAVEQEGPAVEETSAERNARFSGRIIGAKSRMGAALETAKQRGKQIAEQRRDRQAGGRADDESASGSIPYDSQETANAADAPKRRIQFGKAFSGVKEATKNKLGAAIQNARQKDREEDQLGGGNTPPRPFAGVRNRLNRTTTADIGSDVGDDRSDTIKAPNDPVQWECEACTFINTSTSNGSDCCEMCGNSAPQNINGAPSVVGQNAGRGDQVEEEPTTEGGKRIRLGAIGNAVRNARQNRLERRREAVDNNVSRMFHDESSFILKRVHAGNQPPMSVSENVPVIHLKNLEGIWSVSVNVKSHVTSNDCRVKQPEDNQASSDSGTNGSPQTWDQDIPCFLVQSTRLDEPSGTIQREIGYSTLMNLHSMISESIGDVLEKVASRGAESEASTDDGEARNDLWAERLVEQVLIAGRALDCILDSSLSGERLTRVITYQAELFSHFLNSLLRCPLPVDCLLGLSEALGIPASTKEIPRMLDASHLPDNCDSSVPSTESLGRISDLLHICEAGLLRAALQDSSTSDVVSIKLSKEANESAIIPVDVQEVTGPSSMTDSKSHQPIDITLYDPLLPPAVSDTIQEAMHAALINTMAERDEAHAQLIASNVFHVHELEQERRKNEKLKMQELVNRERGRLQQPNVANFFQNLNDDRSKKELRARLDAFETMLMENNETELSETSRQLAEEVSAKTLHALEIVRLKEARELERKNDEAEKRALKDELRRVKALLAETQAKTEKLT